MQVSITEAKARFSALVAAAERGEEVIITRRGTPVACLVAIGPRPAAYRVDTVRAVYRGDPDEPDNS